MKTKLTVLLLWLLFNPVSAADSAGLNPASDFSAKTIQDCINRYQISLRHHNNGVVQSAIINLIQIRIKYPGLNYDSFTSVLKSLEESGRTGDIRILAGICIKCLERHGEQQFPNTLTEQQAKLLLNLLVQANSMAAN